jgi:hypothetical protein
MYDKVIHISKLCVTRFDDCATANFSADKQQFKNFSAKPFGYRFCKIKREATQPHKPTLQLLHILFCPNAQTATPTSLNLTREQVVFYISGLTCGHLFQLSQLNA